MFYLIVCILIQLAEIVRTMRSHPLLVFFIEPRQSSVNKKQIGAKGPQMYSSLEKYIIFGFANLVYDWANLTHLCFILIFQLHELKYQNETAMAWSNHKRDLRSQI